MQKAADLADISVLFFSELVLILNYARMPQGWGPICHTNIFQGPDLLGPNLPPKKSIQLSHTYITLHVLSPWQLWAIQGETWSYGCSLRSTPARNPLPASAASRPSSGADPLLERAP